MAKGRAAAGGALRVGMYIMARRPSPLTPRRRRHHRLTHSSSRRLGRSQELGLLRHRTRRQINCLGSRPASELATMWGGRKATRLDSRRSQSWARGNKYARAASSDWWERYDHGGSDAGDDVDTDDDDEDVGDDKDGRTD